MKMLYTLQIDVIAACFSATINGIPMDDPSDGGAIAYEMPINHLLIPGENLINIIISPSPAHNEYVAHSKTEFTIYQRSFDDLRDSRKVIKHIVVPDYVTNENLKSAVIPVNDFFFAPDIEPPLWTKSDTITLDSYVVSATTKVYKDFHQGLKDKNIELLLRLIQKKDYHYATAYAQRIQDQQNDSRKTFLNAINEPGNVLIEYDVQTIIPQLFAGGKLISMQNDDDWPPLMFYNTQTDITTSFPIYLCKMRDELTIVL